MSSQPQPTPISVHTEDGWTLTAYRHGTGTSKHPPVVIFHALAMTANIYHGQAGNPSVAVWLAERGYDVWFCECRGMGRSHHPDGVWNQDWNFHDHLELDVPAFLATVREKTGHNDLYWIGHSMGGALLLAYLCSHSDPHIKAGVVAAAGLMVSEPSEILKQFTLALQKLRLRRVPIRLLLSVSGKYPWMLTNRMKKYRRQLTGYSDYDKILADAHDVPTALLASATSAFASGGFSDRSAQLVYSDNAVNVTTPLLFLAGDEDPYWKPEVMAENVHLFHPGIADTMYFGKAYGHKVHYGHLDLLLGDNADIDVFPAIDQWLQRIENSAATAANPQQVTST